MNELPESASARATDQLIGELRSRAESLGLVIATRCRYCGAPLWDRRSIRAHAGPVCRVRHTENDPGATPAKKSRTEVAVNASTR